MTMIMLVDKNQLERDFGDLPVKLQKKILRPMVRAGATIVKREFKLQLRKYHRSGTMSKALTIRPVSKGMRVYALVGVKKDARGIYKGKNVIPSKYNHLLELGHRAFRDKLKRYHPAVSGKFPLRKTVEATRGAVKAKVEQVFQEQMRKLNGAS